MLHADDEQRTHLTHEHPNVPDSSPSPLSSRTLTYFDSHRSTSPLHQRSHTITHGSSHLLARLVSLEEEVREINTATVVTTQHLEAETTRANVAERRALHRLRLATESRERAEQESAKLREALKLCQLKLENAQTEIFQAQDVIDQVTFQRIDAEAEAARAGANARKLEEETRMLVMLAREEGRRMGFQERLSSRRINSDEEHLNDDESIPERDKMISIGALSNPRSHVQLHSPAATRQRPMHSESVPPVRTPSLRMRTPTPPRVVPVRVSTGTPSHEDRTPSPSRDLDGPETIHQIPTSRGPIISNQPSIVPIDNRWIPHELLSSSSIVSQVQDSRPTQQSKPTPVRPHVWSRDYAYQMPVPPSIQHEHMPLVASRASTDLSHNDRVNKRPRSSLRNEIYVDRVRSGSQPSREGTPQNEHRDQDLHYSRKTEADNHAEQWGAVNDGPPPLLPRAFTPPVVPHSHQSPRFYDPAEKVVTPPPLWDVNDPRPRTVIPTESTAVRSYLPLDNPMSQPAPTRWDVSTESTVARSHLPPDDPTSQPALTRHDIQTESDGLRMPTPPWDVEDPQPRAAVPTESTATPLRPPLYYLPPDDPVSQPVPTRWTVRTESNSRTKSGIGMPAPPQPRMVVPTKPTAAPLLSPVYYLPPDDPISQPLPTRWDVRTESNSGTKSGIGVPAPPQPRMVVPTESTAASLLPPLYSLPPDDPASQPAPTQWDIRTESNSGTKSGIGIPAPLRDVKDPQSHTAVRTGSTAAPLLPPLYYLPPDDPVSQPAPTQWDIRTESDSLTRPGIGMPTPIWGVKDPQSRTVVPTESTAARSYLPPDNPAPTRWNISTESTAARSYLPPDNPIFQPAPTQWDVRTESDSLTRPGIGIPTPLWDDNDPQSRTVVPTESTAVRLHPSLNDPASRSSRAGLPLEYLRRFFRQLRHRSGSNILNTIIESPAPSEPEKTTSPPATIAAQPHLLSRGAANQPLPREDAHQHQYPPSFSYNPPERPRTPWPAV